MNLHLAMYNESVGSVTNSDINAALDEVLTRRNSHIILTEQYDLLAVFATGSLLDRVRFGNAALTQLGSNHIWPVEVSATIPDLPQIMDRRDSPMRLPMNEEITLEASTTAVGPSDVDIALILGTPAWNMNFPPHRDRLMSRATAVVAAGAESAWTALVEIAFERDLLNGVYAVIGASVVAANAIAFRFRFPDQPAVRGKQLRPGGLVQNATNLQPHPAFMGGFGEWGRFHTFSPPEVQIFDDTAGGTYEIRLDLLYLGQDESLLGAF